jgi:hypothetical protein
MYSGTVRGLWQEAAGRCGTVSMVFPSLWAICILSTDVYIHFYSLVWMVNISARQFYFKKSATDVRNIKLCKYQFHVLALTFQLIPKNWTFKNTHPTLWLAAIAQSVYRLATAWRSGDRILLGAKFSSPVQTGRGAHLASCTMGTRSFPGVESGRGVTLTPHPFLVPRSKNRVDYTSNLPKGLRGL